MTRAKLGIRTDAAATATGQRAWGLTGARAEKQKEMARELRRNPTPAQKALWAQMAGSALGGIKFTRQSIVGTAIVDFACASRWLVVEITGSDESAELAALQDRKLAETGIRVLRFAEAEVLESIDEVVKAINAKLNEPFDRRAAVRRNAGIYSEQ